MVSTAPAANACTSRPSVPGTNPTSPYPSAAHAPEIAVMPHQIRYTTPGCRPSSRMPAVAPRLSGRFDRNTAARNGTLIEPPAARPIPSTRDSGIPSSRAPSTMERFAWCALPADRCAVAFCARAPSRRKKVRAPTPTARKSHALSKRSLGTSSYATAAISAPAPNPRTRPVALGDGR